MADAISASARTENCAINADITSAVCPREYRVCESPETCLFLDGAAIRRALVRKGYIKGIIGLPANLFYGTGIPACIVVVDKVDAAARKGIFMVDASQGFMKEGPKNRLRAQDIHRIVDTFTRRLEVPRYARMVSYDKIEKNRSVSQGALYSTCRSFCVFQPWTPSLHPASRSLSTAMNRTGARYKASLRERDAHRIYTKS
jgi:type I restriction-modification system DNA methylase subunit